MGNCPKIYILDSNKNSADVLRSYLEDFGYKNISFFDDYKKSLTAIKNEDVPPIVFVNIEKDYSEDYEVLESLRLATTKIIFTSTEYSTDTIIRAFRGGARDFLPKPIIQNDLKRVLSVIERQGDTLEVSASKIISVYSNKGGIGKTTLTTNLAVELAKITREKVALIDLNLQLGDVSTFLDLTPSFDVAYVIKNLLEKKEQVLLNAFERYKDTSLHVLSDPSYIEQSESLKPQQIEQLFKTLRKVFPYVVIDVSSAIDSNSLKILDSSDYVLFTTIVNIPAIRNTQRCLSLFKSRHYSNDKVKIIINRYMENDEIKLEDIETALGEKVYWKLPNNYFSIMESINKGVPVAEINASSNIASSYKDLAIKLSDDIVKQTILKHKIHNDF